MASQDSIQALHEARAAKVKAASENRDVDELMTWYSKDAVFEDPVNGIKLAGVDALRAMYAGAYAAMPKFQVLDAKHTGFTADFTVSEMKCKGVAAFDVPTWGLKSGDSLDLIGVGLFWWKWEGKDGQAEWDGSLTEEAVRGWKIVHERAYFQSPKSS